jgi:hypothetical protein
MSANTDKKRKLSLKAIVKPKAKVVIDQAAVAEAKAKDLASYRQTNQPIDDAKAVYTTTPYDYVNVQQRGRSDADQSSMRADTPADESIGLILQRPAAPVWCDHTGQWDGLAEAVVGLHHRNAQPALPCQDAVVVHTHPRPVLVVCDGAGSAAMSEYGARALTIGLGRLAATLELPLLTLLDTPTVDEDQARQMVQMMLRHGKGLLQDIAQQHRREVRDFRSTVLMVMVGKHRLLWLKVGDGAIVLERIQQQFDQDNHLSCQPVLICLGDVGKGEFANQTTFIDEHLTMQDVQWGMLSATGVSGIAAMSDGAAEKLVSNNGCVVAGLVSRWLDGVRQQTLHRRDLTQAFYSERFTQGSTGDDRSIALLAAQMIWPQQ